MENRKVAAAAASVIPFACVICFDEFTTTDRPPMVLPCGHTYVCLPCTKRLKKCMECREPLFLYHNKGTTVPGSGSGTSTHAHTHPQTTPSSSSYSGRFSPQSPATPTKPPPPTPLPIPKNVVLIALMEAAERQKQQSNHQDAQQRVIPEESPSTSSNDQNVTEKDDSEEEEEEESFDLDQIIAGMATLAGPCGTYAVKEPQGLPLYEHDPRLPPKGPPESVLLPQIPQSNSLLDEEKKQDEQLILEVASSAEEDDPVVNFVLHTDVVEPLQILNRGQKIQVVSFENGVARLARGHGFVRATSSQLVKVGGPLDEACRLEGLLDTVENRGLDLEKTLQENNNIRELLKEQLREAEAHEPPEPIIAEAPLPDTTPVDAMTNSPTPHTPSTPTAQGTPEKTDPYSSRQHFYTPQTEYGRYAQGHAPHSPASIDNADLIMYPGPEMPHYDRSVSFEEQENHHPTSTSAFACGVGLSLASEEDETDYRTRPSPSSWSRPQLRTGRETEGSSLTPSLTSSFDGVDFRTGLSGHRGLSHARKLQNSPKPRTHIRMMGEHRGIGHIRVPQRGTGYSSSSSHAAVLEQSPGATRPHSAVPALGPRFSSSGQSS